MDISANAILHSEIIKQILLKKRTMDELRHSTKVRFLDIFDKSHSKQLSAFSTFNIPVEFNLSKIGILKEIL